MATAIRELPHDTEGGCRVLSAGPFAYRDGAEEYVLEVVSREQDISSLSDGLEREATDWASTYHLSKSRANIMRSLTLTRQMTVLEVGSGCGAITRYLGESCGLVDAVEPSLIRAKSARQRTRDLENVEVFVGTVDNVPSQAAYDLIVVVGVLEYVGNGSSDAAPYLEFIRALSRRLNPGGKIVIAIENRLGVRYLAGSPEDHTGRPFEGLEEYPNPGPARTFSRSELTDLLEQAGLHSKFLHAFPDYKLTRLVFSDTLLESKEERSLAWRVPELPSPEWTVPRPRLADERVLWRSLVSDGIGAHFSNSFLVIASSDDLDDSIWPPEQLGVFFNTERRACYTTRTRIESTSDEGVRFHRDRLGPSENPQGPLTHQIQASCAFVSGRDLAEILARTERDTAEDLLKRWEKTISAIEGDETRGQSIDLVPHNFVVSSTGDLVPIDEEWLREDFDTQMLVERGVLTLAITLARIGHPARWAEWNGAKTARDLAESLALVVTPGADPGWLKTAIRRDAEFIAEARDASWGTLEWKKATEVREMELTELMDRELHDWSQGLREHERHQALQGHYQSAMEQISRLREQLDLTEGWHREALERLTTMDLELQRLSVQEAHLRARLEKIERWLPMGALRILRRGASAASRPFRGRRMG